MARIHKSSNIYMNPESKGRVIRPGASPTNSARSQQLVRAGQALSSQVSQQEQLDYAGQSQERTFEDVFRNASDDNRSAEVPGDQDDNRHEAALVNGRSYASANGGYAQKITKEDLSVQQIIRRAEDEAQKIISEARQQAALILQQNKLKVMAEKQAGYQEGFREGQTAAQVMYEQQIAELQKSFYEIAGEMNKKPDEFFARMEEDLLDLALDVAEKIIGQELSRKNKSFHTFLRKALDRLKKQEKATVYLNEREYQLFVAVQPEQFTDDLDFIQFAGDHKLPPGSCLIETSRGRFDASMKVQVEKIKESMKG